MARIMYESLCFIALLCLSTTNVGAQQEYSANKVLNCSTSAGGGDPSSSFLYACNGKNRTCKSFVIFKSQAPYNSVANISKLTSSDPSELVRINNVSKDEVLPAYKEVIVPVPCSCSGQYYQANSSFIIPSRTDTYFSIANDTYQGLSTCHSLMGENPYKATDLLPGFELRIPLRCACPTSDQIEMGTRYLLTYSITWGDNITIISKRFNASKSSTLAANSFSEQDPTIFPFTTILIPLSTEPLSSQTIVHPSPSLLDADNTYTMFLVDQSHKKSKKTIYVGVALGAATAFLLVFFLSLAYKFQFRKKETDSERGRKHLILTEDIRVKIAGMDRALEVFQVEDLKAATNNFSSDFKIQGSVYRGVVNKRTVAIKKMNTDAMKEVQMLNKINHCNLIKLYGVCEVENHAVYGVYEYMENGCLKKWLKNKNSPMVQSWTQRIQIALDIATGIHYLHKFTDPAYVHKDIKSSNILLNKELRAKIANFNLVSSAQKKKASTKFVGTKGYMAPEYLEIGLVTSKMDVYAFGVVMLELITAKEAVIVHGGKELLLSEAILSITEGENSKVELEKFIDPNLQLHWRVDLAIAIANLSTGCLVKDHTRRLSMDKVVPTLLRIHAQSLSGQC